jgi:sugar phosphate isomerase/epimerase
LKFSLSTGSLYFYPLRSIFRIAKETGFAGVELVATPEVLLRGGSYVRQLSVEYGLPVFSLHPPVLFFYPWYDFQQLVSRLVNIAQEARCPMLVLHPPKTAQDLSQGEGQRYVEVVKEHRQSRGVRIAVENRAFFFEGDKYLALSDMRELRAFADEHDLGMVLDTAHVGTSTYSLMETYAIFKTRLFNVHLSDIRPLPPLLDNPYLHTYIKHHQIPGQGWLPLSELVQALHRDGYEGPLTLEISPVALGWWWPPSARNNLKRCIAIVKGWEVGVDG